jgi:hypothetical protein
VELGEERRNGAAVLEAVERGDLRDGELLGEDVLRQGKEHLLCHRCRSTYSAEAVLLVLLLHG